MIKSYCKINLSLRIIKKLKSGFHNIQTNTFLLNFYDEINIKKIKNKKDIILFKGKFKKLVNNSKNSILSIVSILRKEKLIKKDCFFKIIIKKNIPIYSGLGGGSSNAYYLMKHFLKKEVSKKIKEKCEKEIGTDLPLFYNTQTFQNSLKKVKKYQKKFHFFFIIVYPYFKCSTQDIYSKVKKYSIPTKLDFSKKMSDKIFIGLLEKQQNDLQVLAIKKFEPINKIITYISTLKGCHISRMTGSGSACFGMFKSQKLAKLGLKNIKKEFPKYWCEVTKTI